MRIREHRNDDDIKNVDDDDDDDLKEAVTEQSGKIGEHADDDDVDVADGVGDGAGEDEEGQGGQHTNCHLGFIGSGREGEEEYQDGTRKSIC